MPDPTTKPPSPRPHRRSRLCGLCLGTALVHVVGSSHPRGAPLQPTRASPSS
ncbi:hypothetical protein C2845_PM14G06150 [Panicum miliaceum]|uniref:Uncharacterized protein n=1 Tax=Panicum miliaceum TaxID=4540 RepID=A0A3L6PNC6_PANMI|nr:hypothetical protein C2845_PM14G06150 [Panicum miliaceum]